MCMCLSIILKHLLYSRHCTCKYKYYFHFIDKKVRAGVSKGYRGTYWNGGGHVANQVWFRISGYRTIGF